MGDLTKLGTPVYNVNHEANPLALARPELAKKILKLFNDRTDFRIRASNILPDNRLRTGRSVIQGADGKC